MRIAKGLFLVAVVVSGWALAFRAGRKVEGRWPVEWPLTFTLRCAASGQSVVFCDCLAKGIVQRWTPAEYLADAADPREIAVECLKTTSAL